MGYKQIKRCVFCGRYFKPGYRVEDWQKACNDTGCQAKRKKQAQKKWLER